VVMKLARDRAETVGRELRRAILVFLSNPWDELGLTRIEGFLPNALSPVLSSPELGGREGVLEEVGLESGTDSNPPL